jgi:SAM-dependent methyltransferase
VATKRPVEWRQADAMEFPFADEAFDAVVCQFGVMFFPDKSKAFAEARRVLRPAGVLIFSVWDRIGENEFADTVTTALESVFPNDPPCFLVCTPHGYHDRPTIERDVANGGFTKAAHLATVAARSRAALLWHNRGGGVGWCGCEALAIHREEKHNADCPSLPCFQHPAQRVSNRRHLEPDRSRFRSHH